MGTRAVSVHKILNSVCQLPIRNLDVYNCYISATAEVNFFLGPFTHAVSNVVANPRNRTFSLVDFVFVIHIMKRYPGEYLWKCLHAVFLMNTKFRSPCLSSRYLSWEKNRQAKNNYFQGHLQFVI